MARPKPDIGLGLFLKLFGADGQEQQVHIFPGQRTADGLIIRSPTVGPDGLLVERLVEAPERAVRMGRNDDFVFPFMVDESGVAAIDVPSIKEMVDLHLADEVMQTMRDIDDDCRLRWPVLIGDVVRWASDCLDMDDGDIAKIKRRYREVARNRPGPEPEVTEAMLEWTERYQKENGCKLAPATREASKKFFDDPWAKCFTIARKIRERRKPG